MSAGYALRRGGELGFVTLYVYPAPPERSCVKNFAEIERNVAASYVDVQLIEIDHWPSPSGKVPESGYHARFAMTGMLDGKEQPLVSESYPFCPAAENGWSRHRRARVTAAICTSPSWTLLHGLPCPRELDTTTARGAPH